jgi:hypothetical protein
MKRLMCLCVIVAAACGGPGSIVLFAQSVPYAATLEWIPRPSGENVSDYRVQLDALPIVTVPLSSCTATLCSTAVSIPTFGPHNISIWGRNLRISTEPTSLQDGAKTTIAFSLNPAPGAPAATIK